jgi:hypothetical protein
VVAAVRVPVAIATSVVVAACSVIYAGDLDDARENGLVLNGQEGGPPSSGPSDAAAAQSEASSDGGYDGGRGCGAIVPAAKFCADFDQGELLTGFDRALITPNGAPQQTLTLDSAFSYSPGRSLSAKMVGAVGESYTRLEKSFKFGATVPSGFEARVKVRPVGAWSRVQVPITIELDELLGAQSCVALIYFLDDDVSKAIDGSQVNMQRNATNMNDTRELNGFPAIDEWTEFTFIAVPMGPSGGVTVTIQYSPLTRPENGGGVKTMDFPTCKLGTQSRITLGYHYAGAGTFETRYDDLVADWR